MEACKIVLHDGLNSYERFIIAQIIGEVTGTTPNSDSREVEVCISSTQKKRILELCSESQIRMPTRIREN